MKLVRFHRILSSIAILVLLFFALPGPVASAPLHQQNDNPNPPDHPVKLIFIHHSTGGNWLADPSQNELGGDLGRTLMENNFYVSATNYGWGPDSIGDATDIPNWLDWFRSPNSPTYLDALYNEKGQNFGDFGSWPRLAADPGGENQIILFKSCFPNSDLEGRPDDPPDPEGWLSVGHAKYVYNEILQYFATRPDKLFIVITAPPLSSSTHAKNARAFNNWLVEDWLAENNYTQNNVAVFDFYNVLTSPDAHHWYHNGQIEHITADRNTSYYHSGDDHPSADGNRKATEEFLPLLNIYYNRWAATSPVSPQPTQGNEQPTAIPSATSGTSAQPVTDGLIADFESLTPSIAAFWDEATSTRLTCVPTGDAASSGASALKMDFEVVANSWATCVLSFDSPLDWSKGWGLAYSLHAAKAGIPYTVIIYAGSADNRETYISYGETSQDDTNGWGKYLLTWVAFERAEWEADAGAPFNQSKPILGVAFGFDGLENASNAGTVWVDDLKLSDEKPEPDRGNGLPCLGSIILPLLLVGIAWIARRR